MVRIYVALVTRPGAGIGAVDLDPRDIATTDHDRLRRIANRVLRSARRRGRSRSCPVASNGFDVGDHVAADDGAARNPSEDHDTSPECLKHGVADDGAVAGSHLK
ncbi:MAG TPA: hypothetical protein VGI78_14790, partial [Acetobacteraceae bacterium]